MGAAALVLAMGASGVGIADASATEVKVPPPTGLLQCDVATGTLRLSRALKDEPSVKPVRLIFEGTATCDSTYVVGGKAAITDASFRFVWVAAKGSTCTSLPSGAATTAQKFRLTLRGVNAKNKLVTVATVRGTQGEVRTFYNGFTNLGTAQGGDNKAFANEQVVLSSYVSPDALAEQCAGAGVENLPFVGPLYVRVV
jgi:hypothetical protein